jgi:DNA-binding Lrp family transcriptional regulator
LTANAKHLRWIKQVEIPARPAPSRPVPFSSRDRLVAALADRPRTVAQLAQTFGLSQPTMLEQVRRAWADGLIVEVEVAPEERRFATERYYAPAVPVIRAPDAEVIESACVAVTHEMAQVLHDNWSDLLAAFAVTHLAREGWTVDDLWPYMEETIRRLVLEEMRDIVCPAEAPAHGLAWVEEIVDLDAAPARQEERYA